VRLPHAGVAPHCPICECSLPRFKRPAAGVECPRCGSGPSQRLLWLFLLREELLARPGVRILNIEQEPLLDAWLRTRLARFASAGPQELPSLPFDDARFDLVLCSHVLDPAKHDSARELHRVLDPLGVAVIQSSVAGVERSLEDAGFLVSTTSYTDELPRTLVRRCGLDQDAGESIHFCRRD
jgi:SAM-dependent methyltransferase